jgi:predicted ATPase
VHDGRLVLASIAQATGIRDSGPDPLERRMAERLRSSCALLLVDNFEQVVDAADVLAALLGQCPAIKCLVTSRCALRVKGEHEHALLPLPLPPAGAAGANDLLRFPSVELFTQRVQAVLPDWSLNEDNARSIAGICRVWRIDKPAAIRFVFPVTIREYAAGKLRQSEMPTPSPPGT